MTDAPQHAPRLSGRDDQPLAAYRAMSAAAVVGLGLGVLAPLCLLTPLLWPLPLAGIAVCALALARIARSGGELLGRKAAAVGLWLAVGCLAAAATDAYLYRRLLFAEARAYAQQWFDYLAADQPQKAFAMTVAPGLRPPLAFDEAVWEFYRTGPRWRADLESYVGDRLVRTLLALGPNARARPFASGGRGDSELGETAYPIFAVTYEDDGQTKTFFVKLYLQRLKQSDGRGDWRLLRAEGGIRPEGF
jgi:hypothetical protein